MQPSDWSIMIGISSVMLTIVFRNLGREIGSFIFLWAPIILLTIIFSRPDTFTKGPIKILLLYSLIIVGILQYTLWNYMDDWNRIRIFYEAYYLIVSSAILYYYLYGNNVRKLAWLSRWFIICIIITLILTNVALFYEPLLVYQSAATGNFTSNQLKTFENSGAMSYGYAQAVVCLIPILIYHIKRKKKIVFAPIIVVLILILIILTEIHTQVFANILVATFITILSFLWSKKRSKSFFFFSLLGILFITTPSSFFSNAFFSLSSNFEQGSMMNRKLFDFGGFIENPEFDNSTETGSRAERLPLLFEAFVSNPILGDASYNGPYDIEPGAHLFWMNRLTLWGVPGFLLYIFVLYKIFRDISSFFDADYRIYYYLSITALIMMGLMKATGGSESWLMLIVVIPGLYFLPLLNQTKDNSSVKNDNNII